MSTPSIHPAAKQSRAVAWLRIKMLMGAMFRRLSLLFGSCLVLVASLGLLSTVVTLVFGGVYLKGMTLEPALHIGEHEFDCTTWWGVGVLVLFHGFLLVWGVDFVKMGRGKRSASS